MSIYSNKVEQQAAIVNKQARKAFEAEKGMVMENLARIDALDKEAREAEEKRLTPLRQRREAYLKSLRSGNIEEIQSAAQTLFGYIVGEQTARQDKEKKEEQKRKQKQKQGTSRDETR